MTLRDLTTLARDLARYNSGIFRARAAYAQQPFIYGRMCRDCTASLDAGRQLCDRCRDENRRERKRRIYHERKAQ